MQSPSKENNFDILRLILALLVYFAHWNILTSQNIVNPIFHLSVYAVHIFFILSGFLIFWSFDSDQNMKRFFIKRFFRVFPLYGFLIVLQTIFFIFFSDADFLQVFKYFLANILFLNFLAPSAGSVLSGLYVDAINGSLWTLKNEVVFYIFVPLLFVLYKKWGKLFFFGIYVLSVLYMFGIEYIASLDILAGRHANILLFQFPAQVRLFMVGILLYIFFNKFENKNIYLFLGLSLFLLIRFDGIKYFNYTLYPFCIGIVMLYLTYFAKAIKVRFDFSYSLYILHFPVIQLALYFELNPKNPLVSFLLLSAIILLLSYFSEKYIEKKFIQIGKNIIKRK